MTELRPTGFLSATRLTTAEGARTIQDIPAPPGWMTRSACRDADVELFYPDNGASAHIKDAAAKRVCADCPVRPDCLEEALGTREIHGTWGGLTAAERRELLRSAAA